MKKNKYYKLTLSDITNQRDNLLNDFNTTWGFSITDNIVTTSVDIIQDILTSRFSGAITLFLTKDEFDTQLNYTIRSQALFIHGMTSQMLALKNDITLLQSDYTLSRDTANNEKENITRNREDTYSDTSTNFSKQAETPTTITPGTEYIDEYSDRQEKSNATNNSTANQNESTALDNAKTAQETQKRNKAYNSFLEDISSLRNRLYSEIEGMLEGLFFEPFNVGCIREREVLNLEVTADKLFNGYQAFNNNDNVVTGTYVEPETVNIEQSATATVAEVYSGEFWQNIDESYEGKTISSTGNNHVGVTFPISATVPTITENGVFGLSDKDELYEAIDVEIPLPETADVINLIDATGVGNMTPSRVVIASPPGVGRVPVNFQPFPLFHGYPWGKVVEESTVFESNPMALLYTSITITENGTFNLWDLYPNFFIRDLTVNVLQPETAEGISLATSPTNIYPDMIISSSGDHHDVPIGNTIIPAQYPYPWGKVIEESTVVSNSTIGLKSTNVDITANGEYDLFTLYGDSGFVKNLTVNVPSTTSDAFVYIESCGIQSILTDTGFTFTIIPASQATATIIVPTQIPSIDKLNVYITFEDYNTTNKGAVIMTKNGAGTLIYRSQGQPAGDFPISIAYFDYDPTTLRVTISFTVSNAGRLAIFDNGGSILTTVAIYGEN